MIDVGRHLAQMLVLVASLVPVLTTTSVAQIFVPPAFSANPRYDVQPYELSRGKNVQRFSGIFVQRLSENWSSPSAARCLHSLNSATVTFQTFASGNLVVSEPRISCFAESAQEQKSRRTSEVSITADRVLALILVARRFNQEPSLEKNDRDVSHYDVEVYEKDGSLKVLLVAPPLPTDAEVAGCPSTGPIDTSYNVDLRTFTVKLGNMAC